MSGSEISTWQKTKDVLLVGAVSLAVAGILALLSLLIDTKKDIADLKVALAIYQTEQGNLRKDHESLRMEVAEHFREDRDRFSKIARR